MKKAIVVIPTYNEAKNIKTLIQKIFLVSKEITNWEIHIMIVDSDSPDGTKNIVQNLIPTYPRLHLIQTKKEGLGKAYILGFTESIKQINPYVLFEMDADLSHNPEDIPNFLKEIEKGADMVIGTRYSKGGSIPSNWGLHRKILSIGANLIVRLGFMNLKQTEWTNGFRAIRKWVVQKIIGEMTNYTGYVFQVAFLDKTLKTGGKVTEIPVHFVDRTHGVSKINSFQYIIQTLLYVVSHSSFIKFVITGLFGFGVDFSFAYMFISFFKVPTVLANIFSAEIAIISNFFINNFWSFSEKKIQGGIFTYLKKLFVFNLVSSGSLLIQGIGMSLCIQLLGEKSILIGPLYVQGWILYKIGIIALIIIPYSYILYNKVIWKK